MLKLKEKKVLLQRARTLLTEFEAFIRDIIAPMYTALIDNVGFVLRHSFPATLQYVIIISFVMTYTRNTRT